jgi:hypothetical protein
MFTEKNGITLLTNSVRYATPESREAVLKTPMEQGMAMGYDRLEQLLGTSK